MKRIKNENVVDKFAELNNEKSVEKQTIGELFAELVDRVQVFCIKAFCLFIAFAISSGYVYYRFTDKVPFADSLMAKANRGVGSNADPKDMENGVVVKDLESLEALNMIQATTGQNVMALDSQSNLTPEEMMDLIEYVSDEMCRKQKKCVPSIILQGIARKESNANPSAIVLERSLVDTKFKHLEGEGALSKALSPFSFGAMQVNWGWSKNICEKMLLAEGGKKENLYVLLFDPRINVQCALLVFLEKWEMAKKHSGQARIAESIRYYNSKNAPQKYVIDVMANINDIWAEKVRG